MSLRRKRNEIRSATGLAPLFSSDKPKSGSQARSYRGPSDGQTHPSPTLIREDPDLKARRFVPLPAREKLIPKSGGKLRGLGIPTARDRTVQAALNLVLERIFEADFKPVSYGFRPKQRAQDAIAEIHYYTTRSYEWVLGR